MNRDTYGRYAASPVLTLGRSLRTIAELVEGWRNVPGLELWQRPDGEFRVLRYWPEHADGESGLHDIERQTKNGSGIVSPPRPSARSSSHVYAAGATGDERSLIGRGVHVWARLAGLASATSPRESKG